jgi:hypothetical protein
MKLAGKRQRLPVVPGAGGNDALPPLIRAELANEIQATANLERAGRVVVLVLDPDAAPDPLIEQRVMQQWGRPHVRVDPRSRGDDVIECRRLHASITLPLWGYLLAVALD